MSNAALGVDQPERFQFGRRGSRCQGVTQINNTMCYEKGKPCPGICNELSSLQGMQLSPSMLLSSGALTEISYPIFGHWF